jgi:hypothetical protein
MTAVAQVEVSLHRFRMPRGRVIFEPIPRPAPIPRLAQALATAHYLVSLVESGVVRDYGVLAARLGVSQARVSALVALTLLAPRIQEEVLAGQSHLGEKGLVQLAQERSWERQVQKWVESRPSGGPVLEGPDKGREFDPKGLAPSSELDEVQTPFSPLTFADLALGHLQVVGQIDLRQPRGFASLLQAGQEDFVVPGDDRFLHGPLVRTQGPR